MNQLNIATTYALKDRFDLFNSHPDIKFYEKLTNTISGCWLVDRTQTVQLPFRTKLMEKNILPDLSAVNPISLDECCIDRSVELLSSNSVLYFLYSGGIDSTLALTSLIKAGATKDQLIVVCNTDCIRENPNFYNNYIKPSFKLMSSEFFMQYIRTNTLDGKIVLCEPGDGLYGQYLGSAAFEMFGGPYLRKPATRQNIFDFFRAKGLEDDVANCCIDVYQANINLCPRPIETLYDFFWWTHFNWRWQYHCEKLRLRTPLEPEVEAFYATVNFQKWAATHTQYEIKRHSDFKHDYKQLIYEFTNDQEYFDLKIKHVSTSYFYLTDAFVAINADGTKLRPNEFLLMDYYQEDNFIANWISDN